MDITREHPDYTLTKRVLQKYSDLYVGGEQLKSRAQDYLQMRQKEPPDVYGERVARVFYENYVGSIIDWYSATLFKREPILSFDGAPDPAKRFYSAFSEDCDLGGTSLTAMLGRQFVSTLVHGRSYLLVDFPKPTVRPVTRAEEEQHGLSRAYVVNYTAEDLINWSRDERGVFDWVILRQSSQRSDAPSDGGPRKETKWIYYDRQKYQIYTRIEDGKESPLPLLVDEGFHGLASQHVVPLFELTVSDGLSLMNKAALLQLEHFNKSNALAWALSMGLFAMPVIYSDKEWKQIVGESYYIQLGSGDRFGWTEPEGRVYQIAAENLARLQEEIYRVSFLQHQARGIQGSGVSQSGLSKQRDFSVTQEVLRAYGDTIKDYTKKILRAISIARQDTLQINVSGMEDFDIGEFASDLADAGQLLGLGIASPTLKAHVFKKLAAKYLCDVRQGIKDQINLEIDNSLLQ
ncbi:MAG TPA: hypothetical protein VM120_28490 [Bryobacteraceae bacterium]|nr:hypothetical protein [Bryobacteraceae bacterium]